MDDHKVKAILDWELPRSVPTLRSFLRLASYYRKFIKNFAKMVTFFTNLLKILLELTNGREHATRPLRP